MVIQTPQHHRFPHSITKKILNVTGCSAPEWEISVPRKDDIAWSIVLSYLISTNYRDREDFTRRLKALTGSDQNKKNISKVIRFFNPFRNRYACFYDKLLKQVICQFKHQLNWNTLIRVSDKLSAAADLLNCQILLLEKTESGDVQTTQTHVYTLQTHFYTTKSSKSKDMITLFFSSSTIEEEIASNVYNFMLSKKFGYKLRSCALLFFLREAELSQKFIRKIMSLDDEEHFLISILNSSFRMVLHHIYKSPYIVSRLAEAGYKVDPRSTDVEGMSALYHAIKCGDSKIFYELYYYAANSCFESEGSFRNPDSHIVSNLLQLETILSNDLSKFNKFRNCENRDNIQKSFDDLLVLNKFFIEINRGILNINSKLNYYDSIKEELFEASKRRDIIVTILNTYEEFFMGKRLQNLDVPRLEDFILHKSYYNSLDMISGIQFFDNIAYLKQRLVSENTDLFSDIESCFFFSVLFSVALDKLDASRLLGNYSATFDFNRIYGFQLMQRIDTFHKMTKFREILQNTEICQDNIVKNIPKDEIFSILNSYPEIKDLIQISKLKYYLKTASSVKVIDLKSVMVIQRVLHVVGEYITPETENDFSVRRFLLLSLPKEISQILHRIRHEMSHLKGHSFPYKFEFEKNLPCFKSIQKEIFRVEKYLRPVFRIHLLSHMIYLFEKFAESLREMKTSEIFHSYNFQDIFAAPDDVIVFLENFVRIGFFASFSNPFLTVFERILKNVEEEITKYKYWEKSSESIMNEVKYTLWPLKCMVELWHTCNQSDPLSLLQILKKLEQSNLLHDLKKNTLYFLEKCKELRPSYFPQKFTASRNLETIEYSQIFLKILRGFTYLSDFEKDKIRKEIPPAIKESIAMKEKLIQTIEKDGFFLSMEELTKIKIIHLSKSKLQKLYKHYKSKNLDALEILKSPDPITELEEVFSKNSLDEKKHKPLCDIMQFSEESRKKLWKLVPGQKKKVPGNNLSNLLNRIQLMKKILIEDNKEILELWTKTKSEKARSHLASKIVQLYLKNRQLRAAIEMLLFDCMVIFESEWRVENPWIKSSKLYRGINLRNVIGHGSPLLEDLSRVLDPEDLPSEIIRKVIRLIEGENAVMAIIELYERLQFDYPRFQEVINSNDRDEFDYLRSRILNCDEGRIYSLLLPYRSY